MGRLQEWFDMFLLIFTTYTESSLCPKLKRQQLQKIRDSGVNANPGTFPPDDRRPGPEDLQLSDLKLVILGSAFFVVWAVNVSRLRHPSLGVVLISRPQQW
jgi:hypothetical protein